MANPYFNAAYYLATNLDVLAAGYTVETAEQHYLQYGAAEALSGANTARKPAPWFDIQFYLTSNPDLLANGIGADNAFWHFTTYGQFEQRSPANGLTVTDAKLKAYADANEDLRTAFGITDTANLTDAQKDALTSHFYQYGYAEDRAGSPFDTDTNPGETFTLTAAPDYLTGTSGDDVFSAMATAAGVATFQSFDKLKGGAGDDTLIAQNVGNLNTNVDTLDSIENLHLVGAIAANTLNLTNTKGVESVLLDSSAGAYTVSNIGAGIEDVGVYSNTANPQTFTFKTEAVSGAEDEITLHVSSAQNTINLNPVSGVNGFETINVVAAGGDSSVTLDDGTSTSLKTVNINASAANTSITLAAGAAASAVNASASTGKVTADVSNNVKDVTVTGGAGDDTIIFGNTLTKADKIDGGAGKNTLQFNSAASTLTDTFDVTNVQTLRISDALAGNLDVSKFGSSVNTVRLDVGHATARTISKLANDSVLELRAGPVAGTTLVLADASATDNALTVNLRANLAAGGATTVNFNTVTATGVEKITVDSGSSATPDNAGDNNIIALTAANLETVVVKGNAGLTINGLGGTVKSIDSTALVAAVTPGAVTGNGGLTALLGSAANQTTTVTAGNGNNFITSAAGNDNIITGTGADVVVIGTGNDTVSLGAGNDVLVITGATDLTKDDKIDAGEGRDILEFRAAQTVIDEAFTNVKGFEVINLNVADSVNLNLGSAAAAAFGNAILVTNVNNNATASNINGSSLASSVTLKVQMGTNDADHTLVGGSGNDVLYGGNGIDTMTGGAGADKFAFLSTAFTNTGIAGGDTSSANMDKVTDFSAGVDKIVVGTGANAFGAALQFSTATTATVTTFTNAANRADLTALAAAAEAGVTGVASTAAAAQFYIVKTGAEITTATGLANKTFLVLNDDTAAIAATDTWIDITGVVGTLSGSDIQFADIAGLFA